VLLNLGAAGATGQGEIIAPQIGPTLVGDGQTGIASRLWGGVGEAPPANTPEASPPTAMIVDVTGL